MAFPDNIGGQVALVRVERAFLDHERIGFFRIGLLPILIVDNVQIELLGPGDLGPKLTQIELHLTHAAGARAVEFRNLCFRYVGDKEPRLRAKVVHSTSAGVWRCNSGVVVDRGHLYEFEEAELITTGPRAWSLNAKSGKIARTISLLPSAAAQDSRADQSND